MALKELYEALKGEGDFWKKVAGACLMAALEIKNEGGGTPNHTNRLLWAVSVKENSKDMARQMMASILSDVTISVDVSAATDAVIQIVVNSLIDTYATG